MANWSAWQEEKPSGAPTGYKLVIQTKKAGGTTWYRYYTVKINGEKDDGDGKATGTNNGGSSGSGSGSSSGDKKQDYIEYYRLKFGNTAVSPPSSLLSKAVSNKWSLAYFWLQVRRNDKRYIRSPEAVEMMGKYKSMMAALFPNKADQNSLKSSPIYKQYATRLLRGDVTLKTLGYEIAKDKRWLKYNPYYTAFQKGQAAKGKTTVDPFIYKAYLAEFQQAFEQYGMELQPDFARNMFKSGIDPGSLAKNLETYAQMAPSFGWFTGAAPTGNQQEKMLLGGKGAADLKARLSQAFRTQAGMVKTEASPFESSLNEQKQLVKPLL